LEQVKNPSISGFEFLLFTSLAGLGLGVAGSILFMTLFWRDMYGSIAYSILTIEISLLIAILVTGYRYCSKNSQKKYFPPAVAYSLLGFIPFFWPLAGSLVGWFPIFPFPEQLLLVLLPLPWIGAEGGFIFGLKHQQKNALQH
jgi:hypothetical protein